MFVPLSSGITPNCVGIEETSLRPTTPTDLPHEVWSDDYLAVLTELENHVQKWQLLNLSQS
jgi:hypothetical protein